MTIREFIDRNRSLFTEIVDSRYARSIFKNCEFYLDQRKVLPYLTLAAYKKYLELNAPIDITIFKPQWKYRPDIASKDIYGKPDYWWILMIVNDIYNIYHFDLTLSDNAVLRYPRSIDVNIIPRLVSRQAHTKQTKIRYMVNRLPNKGEQLLENLKSESERLLLFNTLHIGE